MTIPISRIGGNGNQRLTPQNMMLGPPNQSTNMTPTHHESVTLPKSCSGLDIVVHPCRMRFHWRGSSRVSVRRNHPWRAC